MTDRETIAVYDARAGDYAKLEPSDIPSETLAMFIEALPDGARVLDLGCGPGTSARHMVRAGCVVDAVDASAEMIRLASAIDGVTARQAHFDDISGTAVYDGVWANFSLLHAPRAQMPDHLAAIHEALKPGGLFHIAVKEGSGEARDSINRLYTYYTEAELTDLLQTAGFSVGPYRRGRDKGLSGEDADWISVTAYA
ncbi:class I SAM-dependent methyltransferase [Marivita sp. XM-24bin2]|jgi:2-polyprenyl-3-methyl-5-hydroxy-6-metoxy-1,4-benzoquinol methylase|uniref:class I SAM-dependent DNA methyltransferase n=1 Tax=unclassified Marivita TaxID=2632480 RepID=UPI000D7B903C|nr:class I SAM-dependent methyltransferase [Marivita sp. XM-24bin2]MCR9108132.1 class I SAM-dependent methyltransferase [Paracoccaceae bacterium]PWL37052.1 MAG: SAM-dependent methyltransferase [Marivita sp. XM-24bin2]